MKVTIEIPVPFTVQYEQHDLKTFQAEDHFVPAVRQRDAEGNLTAKSRKWKGANVHAMTLLGPDGVPHRMPGPDGKPLSTHRALSDSRKESERLLTDQIREGFFARLRAQEIVEFSADQARRVKDERDRLVAWFLQNQKPGELAKVLGIAESAVEQFKRSQEDPALKATVDQMLRGSL